MSGVAAPAAASTTPPGQAKTASPQQPALPAAEHRTGQSYPGGGLAGARTAGPGTPPAMLPPNVAYDLTLRHPRCVFQLLKRQYSRYTPEMVERITGIDKEKFLQAA